MARVLPFMSYDATSGQGAMHQNLLPVKVDLENVASSTDEFVIDQTTRISELHCCHETDSDKHGNIYLGNLQVEIGKQEQCTVSKEMAACKHVNQHQETNVKQNNDMKQNVKQVQNLDIVKQYGSRKNIFELNFEKNAIEGLHTVQGMDTETIKSKEHLPQDHSDKLLVTAPRTVDLTMTEKCLVSGPETAFKPDNDTKATTSVHDKIVQVKFEYAGETKKGKHNDQQNHPELQEKPVQNFNTCIIEQNGSVSYCCEMIIEPTTEDIMLSNTNMTRIQAIKTETIIESDESIPPGHVDKLLVTAPVPPVKTDNDMTKTTHFHDQSVQIKFEYMSKPMIGKKKKLHNRTKPYEKSVQNFNTCIVEQEGSISYCCEVMVEPNTEEVMLFNKKGIDIETSLKPDESIRHDHVDKLQVTERKAAVKSDKDRTVTTPVHDKTVQVKFEGAGKKKTLLKGKHKNSETTLTPIVPACSSNSRDTVTDRVPVLRLHKVVDGQTSQWKVCGKPSSLKRSVHNKDVRPSELKMGTTCSSKERIVSPFKLKRSTTCSSKERIVSPFKLKRRITCFSKERTIQSVSLTKIFKCKVCDLVLSTSGNLRAHYKIHTGEKPFQCSVCGKSFPNNADLTRHSRIHSSERIRPFECSLCGKCFENRHYMKIHKMRHTGVKPFKCKSCNKCFVTVSARTTHEAMHQEKVLFDCNICGQQFSSKGHMQRHQIVHTGKKPFKCKVCDLRFRREDHLTIHMRTHTGDKPFACKICDKSFSTSEYRKQHELIHSGKKNYSCRICDEAFVTVSARTRHEKVHTSEKPYKCKFCGKCFSLLRKKNSHQRKHKLKVYE